MLPNVNFDSMVSSYEEEQEKTKTFGLNITDRVLGGMVDGLSALRQSIYLMLSIEADQYIIYPYTYGVNTLDLIGKPSYYVVAILPDRIRETLLRDDRILDVSDFEFDVIGNKVHAKFTIHTIYGDVNEETVVIY